MIRPMKALFLPLLALAAAQPLAAQDARRPIELGIDAGISRQSLSSGGESYTYTTVQLPIQSFRAGFFLSDRVSLEPTVALQYFKGEDEDGYTTYGLGAGLLYHLTTDTKAPQFFVRPLVGYAGSSGGGDDSGSGIFGFGGGVKLHGQDRLAFRIGVDYQRRLKSDEDPAVNVIGATFGISFFTR